MQGPALCVQNNSVFSDRDIESIQKLGVGSKSMDPDKTGQFGTSVYYLKLCPNSVSFFSYVSSKQSKQLLKC